MEISYILQNYVDTSGEIKVIKKDSEENLVQVEAFNLPKGFYRLDFGTMELASHAYDKLYRLGIKVSYIRSLVSFELISDYSMMTFTLKARNTKTFIKDLRVQEMMNRPLKKSELSL